MRTAALVTALLFAALALPAMAEDGRAACRTDAKVVCAEVFAARDRAAVKACLIRNIDKVSPACRDLMRRMQAQGGKVN